MANKEKMYRVLVIAISLKNNQIAHSKDEVAESLFSAPIADLIKGGYIEEVTDSNDEVADAKMELLKQDLLDNASEDDDQEDSESDEYNNDESDNDFPEIPGSEPSPDLSDIANSIPGSNKSKGKK